MGNRQGRLAKPCEAPLGEWVSPITSEFITAKAVKLKSVQLRSLDGALLWLEGRPEEGGRQVLVMRRNDGSPPRDITPPPDSGFNVRTTVHEYGGAEYCLVGDTVYFTNFKDQAIYRQDLTDPAAPVLVTRGSAERGERFAEYAWDEARGRLVGVCEVHPPGAAEGDAKDVVNCIVAVDVVSGAVTRLAGGADFYACPRVSPCGRWLAWMEWRFPNMPWDHTSIMAAAIKEDGSIGEALRVAGGDSSVQQPTWSPDSSYLYYIDDRTGWWNLYRVSTDALEAAEAGVVGGGPTGAGPAGAPTAGTGSSGGAAGTGAGTGTATGTGTCGGAGRIRVVVAGAAEALCPREADFGFPMWTLGLCSYQVLPDGHVLALLCEPSRPGVSLALVGPMKPRPAGARAGSGIGGGTGSGTARGTAPGKQHGAFKLMNTGLTHFGSPASIALYQEGGGGGGGGKAGGRRSGKGGPLTVAVVGGSPSAAAAVMTLRARSAAALGRCGPRDWGRVRSAASTQIPAGYLSAPQLLSYPTSLDGQPATAHMVYYPPANRDFTLPPGHLPPLLVNSHGGPTSAAAVALNPTIQYWTSRGFAVADVDYGGSTGYGREYRDRLKGRWGLVDVEDCCRAAEWLAAAGRVDPKRLCISGGSAGGFTTLACLAFRRTFSAGASLYGVADLRLLAEHTHKFESRYLDLLVAPLASQPEVYQQRSPLAHAQDMAAPVIFFQGDQDRVVPPEQAVAMHEAVKAAGLPTALVMFEGEQHGFRQASSIRRALDGELFFYGAVLRFPAAMPPDLPPIAIDNMPQQGAAGAGVGAGAAGAGAKEVETGAAAPGGGAAKV